MASREVHSPQESLHTRLDADVHKHMRTLYRKPFSRHTLEAFAAFRAIPGIEGGPLILDSGCGTGTSTLRLARENPQACVVGIDKSAARLARQREELPANCRLLRADLVDFWRLLAREGIGIQQHFLLYPNPWPKPEHLLRRWHGHPVFPYLLHISERLELRTNWYIYAAEFARALYLAEGVQAQVEEFVPEDKGLTPFERKYAAAGQGLFRVRRTTTDVLPGDRQGGNLSRAALVGPMQSSV